MSQEKKVDMVTVSSRGQVSIPSDIRKESEIEEGTKLLVMSSGDSILMKKVRPSVIEKDLEEVMEPLWKKAKEEGLEEKDAERLVQETRE